MARGRDVGCEVERAEALAKDMQLVARALLQRVPQAHSAGRGGGRGHDQIRHRVVDGFSSFAKSSVAVASAAVARKRVARAKSGRAP